MIPLTKTMNRGDLDLLAEEIAIVDSVGLSGQTPEARRWEYAMALRAQTAWWDAGGRGTRIADVGGAGSPFYKMVGAESTFVIDLGENESLAEYLHGEDARLFPQVFCLSVLEHVEDVDQFLYHLGCLVAPGGLLFLTMDCWDRRGCPDTAHFHWMRKRIFEVPGWIDLMQLLRDFETLGGHDLRYHDHQLYGSYSVASLALRKRA